MPDFQSFYKTPMVISEKGDEYLEEYAQSGGVFEGNQNERWFSALVLNLLREIEPVEYYGLYREVENAVAGMNLPASLIPFTQRKFMFRVEKMVDQELIEPLSPTRSMHRTPSLRYGAEISEVGDFDELYQTLEKTGGLRGSERYYDSRYLIHTIEEVRNGNLELEYVTTAGGLRDKVEELIS